MQTHKRSCLEGPISRHRPWWQDIEAIEDAATGDKTLFRAGLVEQIRREIAAGTYDTEEKWEIALDRLMKRMEAD
jgi:hypothetical protein